MKTGIKTTEFWLSALVSVLTLLNQSGLLGSPLPVEAILAVVGTVVSYVFGRSTIKSSSVGTTFRVKHEKSIK